MSNNFSFKQSSHPQTVITVRSYVRDIFCLPYHTVSRRVLSDRNIKTVTCALKLSPINGKRKFKKPMKLIQ